MSTVTRHAIDLTDLLGTLTADEFRQRHWRAGVPFASEPNPALVEKVRALAPLARVENLVPLLSDNVHLLGPNRFRADVPIDTALLFLKSGYNLFLRQIERAVPEAIDMFAGIARQLGLPPWQMTIEAFAGAAGGISTRHFDHDINFQILLEGEKVWRFEENTSIDNPLAPYHPALRPDGTTSAFEEPAYAKGPVPDAFDPARVREVRVSAGSVVFVPRGHWHEVESTSATWGINIVFRGVTWATALGNALVARLHEDAEFRAYCENIAYGGDASGFDPDAAAAQFGRLREAAIAALRDMTRNEAALSLLDTRYRWSISRSTCEIVAREDGPHLVGEGIDAILLPPSSVPVVERLVTLLPEFSWSDALTVGRQVGATAVFNLLNRLVRGGALTRVAGKSPP